MVDLFEHLDRAIKEPKIYALLVHSQFGQVLHLGIHFSLDEAYAAARKRLEDMTRRAGGEVGVSVEIDLWNVISARDAIKNMLNDLQRGNTEGRGIFADGTIGEIPINRIEQTGNLPLHTNYVDDGTSIEGNFEDLPDVIQQMIRNKIETGRTDREHVSDISNPPQGESIDDQVRAVRDSKSTLMKSLINDGDEKKVENVSKVLGPSSKRYVINEIRKRKKKSTSTQGANNKKSNNE